MTLAPTQLAYVVDETTENLQRHLREVASSGTMLKLLENVASVAKQPLSSSATLGTPDPLDKMILALCGDKGSQQRQPLHEIVEREASLYRLRVARGKQHLKKIVFGATPETRLQTIVNATVAVAHAEQHLPQRPMTKRLGKLVEAIEAVRTTQPDLIGRQFNLADAQALLVAPSPPAAARHHRAKTCAATAG
ncbi:MAG: hypothetical protein KBA75_09150 [Alphaproteobacteria bacterium]|nr:hypothetical protein [Alphaproteobacteria bacterium]